MAEEVALSLEKLWSARTPTLPGAARGRKEEHQVGTASASNPCHMPGSLR